jgi:hypothetical protein
MKPCGHVTRLIAWTGILSLKFYKLKLKRKYLKFTNSKVTIGENYKGNFNIFWFFFINSRQQNSQQNYLNKRKNSLIYKILIKLKLKKTKYIKIIPKSAVHGLNLGEGGERLLASNNCRWQINYLIITTIIYKSW